MKYLLISLLLFVLPLNAEEFGNKSYFLERKKMLEDMNITLYPQPKYSRIDKIYYSQNQTHSHNHTLLINEADLCSQHRHVFLLIMIRSHYRRYELRNILREQMNHFSPIPYRYDIIVKHVFLFGKTSDPIIEESLRNESLKHNDIVQEDFTESYVNLLRKVIMGWKWAVTFCTNAEYIFIGNDEMLIDGDKLISFLMKDYLMAHFKDHFAVCCRIGGHLANHVLFKQFTDMNPEILYKGKLYPYYCHGYGYVAHIMVINQLYKASFTNPPFMPTDVWIGVLSEKLRLKIPNHSQFFVVNKIEEYFANPLYPIEPGMIAVTDYAGYKGHELQVMKNIRKSMRQHLNHSDNLIKFRDETRYKLSAFEYSLGCPTYIFLINYTLFVLIILLLIYSRMRTRLLV